MMNKCKMCGKKSDLRFDWCFDCAEIQSVLVNGLDMYDKPILSKGLGLKDANKFLEFLKEKGYVSMYDYQHQYIEKMFETPYWRGTWFGYPFFWLAQWIQVFLWKRGIHTHNILTRECTPDFSCCMDKIKASGNEHIIKAIVDAANGERDSVVCIKNVDNPN